MKIRDGRQAAVRMCEGFRFGLCLLAAALFAAGPCAGARRPTKVLASPVELDLVMDAPTPTVMVQTDRGYLTMLIDTGSTVTSLAKGARCASPSRTDRWLTCTRRHRRNARPISAWFRGAAHSGWTGS